MPNCNKADSLKRVSKSKHKMMADRLLILTGVILIHVLSKLQKSTIQHNTTDCNHTITFYSKQSFKLTRQKFCCVVLTIKFFRNPLKVLPHTT